MQHEHEIESPLFKANNITVAALTLMRDGKFDKAIPCLDEALSYTADLWCLKGTSLRQMDDYGEALKCFKRALELNPQHTGARMGRGVALHYLGKYRQAISAYNALIADGKDVALSWFNKACAYSMLEKDKETFKCLGEAHKLDPFNTGRCMLTDESFDRIRKHPEFLGLTETGGSPAPAKVKLEYIG